MAITRSATKIDEVEIMVNRLQGCFRTERSNTNKKFAQFLEILLKYEQKMLELKREVAKLQTKCGDRNNEDREDELIAHAHGLEQTLIALQQEQPIDGDDGERLEVIQEEENDDEEIIITGNTSKVKICECSKNHNIVPEAVPIVTDPPRTTRRSPTQNRKRTTNKRPFKCNDCNARCATADTLQKHKSKFHSFQCKHVTTIQGKCMQFGANVSETIKSSTLLLNSKDATTIDVFSVDISNI